MRPEGRVVAVADLGAGSRYRVRGAAEPVGDPATLLARLGERPFLGLDVPLGLPAEWAERAGVVGFREGLALFGAGRFASFYETTDAPSIEAPFGPRGNAKGGLSRAGLAAALGLSSESALFRACDLATSTRPRAEALFFTRFAKQVGRAAGHAWREVVAPGVASGRLALWPFDGPLGELLGAGRGVAAEVYPAEGYRVLGLPRFAKARRGDRARVAPELLAAARALDVDLPAHVEAQVASGFESSDAFDAFVALLTMVAVLRGTQPLHEPQERTLRFVEGWILGQAGPSSRP